MSEDKQNRPLRNSVSVELPLLTKGYADSRWDQVSGERFYMDQGQRHRHLIIQRQGQMLRFAQEHDFIWQTSAAAPPAFICNNTALSEHVRAYFLQHSDQEPKAADTCCDAFDLAATRVPQDLIDACAQQIHDHLSFRFTYETRQVAFHNTLGTRKTRTDKTQVVRLDLKQPGHDEALHLRLFLHHPTVATLVQAAQDLLTLAHSLRDAKSPKPGDYPVLLHPTLASVFAHEVFGHLAEHIRSPWDWNQLKQMQLPPSLNVDDEHTANSPVHLPFDDEGVTPRSVPIVAHGCFQEPLTTLSSSLHLGFNPTGRARAQDFRYRPLSRMNNISIRAGTQNLAELLHGMKDGYYFIGSLGGLLGDRLFQINAQYGYRVRHGRLAEPVTASLLTGHMPTTLLDIIGIGNDHQWVYDGGCLAGNQFLELSGRGAPHLLIRKMRVL